MKNLIIILLFLGIVSCADDFTKEKYDISLNFENTTQEKIKLSIFEINNKAKWESKIILPNDKLNIIFNIKEDIGIHEGGFIFKAYFENGDSTEINTGYFTNFQFLGKNPAYFSITKEGFQTL